MNDRPQVLPRVGSSRETTLVRASCYCLLQSSIPSDPTIDSTTRGTQGIGCERQWTRKQREAQLRDRIYNATCTANKPTAKQPRVTFAWSVTDRKLFIS